MDFPDLGSQPFSSKNQGLRWYLPSGILVVNTEVVLGWAFLHDIRNITLLTAETCFSKHLVQQFARFSDKRDALTILFSTRSLPHDYDLRVPGSVTGH
jgi:hypothetical protein